MSLNPHHLAEHESIAARLPACTAALKDILALPPGEAKGERLLEFFMPASCHPLDSKAARAAAVSVLVNCPAVQA